MFDKSFTRVNMFVDFRTELVEGSSKRAGEELEQDSTKKHKIYKEGKKRNYQIVRADGKSQMYKVFSQMLKSFTREDLEDLYKLVKAKYGSTRPVEDLDLNDLHAGRKEIPLTPPIITDMLNKKLQGRIVEIKSLLNAASITAALIDVNVAQYKVITARESYYSWCKVTTTEGVNAASEEVSTAYYKAPIDKKTKRKRITTSSKPKTSKVVRESPLKEQVADTQPTKEPVTTVDTTQSLGNDTDRFIPPDVDPENSRLCQDYHILEDPNKGIDSGIVSIGNVRLEDVSVNNEDNPFDTESKIKVVKRFQPRPNDEDQITFLGPVYDEMDTDPNMFTIKTISGSLSIVQKDVDPNKVDSGLVSMPEYDIELVDDFDVAGSETDDTIKSKPKVNMSKSEEASVDQLLDELDELARTKCSTLDTFADKNADSDPLGHLHKEISSLTSKAQHLGSFNTQQVAYKLEEYVPELVAEELKATLPEILTESLKNAMPQIVVESVKQTIKKSVKKAIPKVCCVTKRSEKSSKDKDEEVHQKEGYKGNGGVLTVSTAMVVDTLEENTSEEQVLEEEPPFKRLKYLIPNPTTSSPTPLIFVLPQDVKQPTMVNMSIEQFTDGLFKTTSSEYSPTPLRDERKGKGISTEEDPLKVRVPLIDEGGSTLKMPNLNQFSIYKEGKLTLDDVKAQWKKCRGWNF
ncbi:hypothetical protein Tco_1302142 [Tanacetum coccineum]